MSNSRKLSTDDMDNEYSTKKQHCNYDVSSYEETYSILKFVLKISGIRLTVKESTYRRLCWNIYYWVEFVNIFIGASLELINMVQTAANGSFVDIFLMMPCVGYVVLAMSKSYKMVYNRSIYENLIDELRGMWPKRSVTQEEHLIVSKSLKYIKFISKGYFWCNVTLNTIFVCPPFINIVKRLAGRDAPLILAFFFWLPFDPYQKGIYEFMLLLQTWECTVAVCWNLAGDMLFCVFLSHITTQFDLLSARIIRVFHVPVDQQLVLSYPLARNNDVQEANTDIDIATQASQHRAELAKIIVRHQTLIRLSTDIEDIFSFSLLLNFLNSSIILCFCGFCVVFVEKWNVINYKLFLLSATTEIWLLCWYGQKLLDSSAGVSDALYNSGWYMSTKEIKKSILIMMHRSQKEVSLTTYGFSVVSLASYSTIIKTSWSYFTLLINMYDK